MSDQFTPTVMPASVGDCLQRAWLTLKTNIWLFIGFTLLFIVASGIVSAVLGIVPFGDSVAHILDFVFPVSLYTAFQAGDGGREIQFQDFFNWTPRFGRLLLGSVILYVIIMAVVLPLALIFGFSYWSVSAYTSWEAIAGVGFGLIGLLFIFLIFYGIVTLAFHFLLLKRDLNLGETLALSARTGLKHIGPIILFGFLALGLVLLGAIACGLGLLVTLPLIVGTQYFFLLSLFPDARQTNWDFEQPTPPSYGNI